MNPAMDFATLTLGRRPNRFLMAPQGLCQAATPHAESPTFEAPPDRLLDAIRRVALAEPRTALVSERELGLKFVQRSRIFRLPDTIDVRVVTLGDGRAAPAFYGRAKYGFRDFGVNEARIRRWLTALPVALKGASMIRPDRASAAAS